MRVIGAAQARFDMIEAMMSKARAGLRMILSLVLKLLLKWQWCEH